MESLSIAGGIIKVAKAIVKAASGVRQCKSRCQDLARRVEVIAELVRESEAAPSDSATRTRVLDRLRDALEEALEVVQSCRSFTKLLLAGRSTSSRIDDAERKINNCLLELGVANDVRLLGLGSQCQSQSEQATTAAGRVAVHDGVVPRTNTVVNNSGIVMNINAKCANVSLKQKSSMGTYISAGGSVSTYFGDSSSRNGIKEDSVAAIHNNSSLVSASAGGSRRHMRGTSVRDDDFNWNARKQDVTTMHMRGNRWYDKNGQATAGEGIQKAAAAAAGPQMLSTTRHAASDMYWPGHVCFKASQARSAPGKDLHPRPSESNAWWSHPKSSESNAWWSHPRRSEPNAGYSTESQASLPVFKANRPWTSPPHGRQDYQYPYGAANDHGDVPYYYDHHSVEENPSSCSIM